MSIGLPADAPMISGVWLLAIDTSTEQAGLALFDGTRLIELSWSAGRLQTTSVLPRISHLLESLGLTISDVGAIAVARGPGTFTGLRVGLSIAKGMAITGERSLIALDTLKVTALPFVAFGSPVLAVLPAGRQRLVWTIYDGRLEASVPRNTTLAELTDYLAEHPETVVAGEMSPDQRMVLTESHTATVSPASGARRPGVLAELAWERWKRGDADDPTTLEPLYLHGKAMGGPTGE